MSIHNLNDSVTYIANFPRSQAGKLGNVYYRVLRGNGTTLISRTNSSIVEFGDGCYGIELSIANEGGYVIKWDIDGTVYTAHEDIDIHKFVSDNVYSGYGT